MARVSEKHGIANSPEPEARIRQIVRYSSWAGIAIFVATAIANIALMSVLTHHLRVGVVVSWATLSVFLLTRILGFRPWARVAWILLSLFLIPSLPVGLFIQTQLGIPSDVSGLSAVDTFFKFVAFLFTIYIFAYLCLPDARSVFRSPPESWIGGRITRTLGIVAVTLGLIVAKRSIDGYSRYLAYHPELRISNAR